MFVDKLRDYASGSGTNKTGITYKYYGARFIKTTSKGGILEAFVAKQVKQDKDARLKNVTVGKYSYGTQDTIVADWEKKPF